MQYVALGPHLVVATAIASAACVVATVVAYPAIARRDWADAVRKASRVLLVVAALAVLDLTLTGTTSASGSLNLIPGAGIAESFETSTRRNAGMNGVENLLGNVLMFAPLGFLARLALERGVLAVTALGAMGSVLIEAAQLLLGDRWSDIDDVLLNSIGALLGALAAVGVVAVIHRRQPIRLPAR